MIKRAEQKSARCFFLMSLFVITGSMNLFAQWIKQSPIPTYREIRDACFISPDTGWIFGFAGTVLRTNDGGASWIDVSTPGYSQIIKGTFLDSDHGWVASSDEVSDKGGEISGTTDGGNNWTMQFYDYSCAIRDLSFINQDTGWALAFYRTYGSQRDYQNFFLKTIDGGNNWVVLDSMEFGYFERMDFIDDSLGYIVGNGTPNMMKTIDGGLTWDTVAHISQSELTYVLFTDAANGYTCGSRFYYTHDSAKTWNETYCGAPWRVDMYDDSNGWAISGDHIYKISNGGANVDQQFAEQKSLLLAISAVDSSYAYAIGRYVSVYKTGNSGENWQEISNGTHNSLTSVFFLDDSTGWAGGDNRAMVHTNDGGEHWIYTQLSSGHTVTDIQFVNADTGWYANGSVFQTTNGGLDWYQYWGWGWDYRIFDLYFLNSQTGWCVGSYGLTYKSQDGGDTWVEQNSGTDKELNAVYFVNENVGWIAGENIVMKTTDGGETWEESYVGLAPFLKIRFFDENTGYVLADQFYLKTYTGGEYWHVVVPEGMDWMPLEDMRWLDQETGFLSGNYYLLKTTDGGENWVKDNDFPDMQARAMWFTDELNGWLVGTDGKIYHTETGGTVGVPHHKNSTDNFAITIFPNPARETVKIIYRIEQPEDVEIGIYTLPGMKIYNQYTKGVLPGTYSYTWDTGIFPSGIYLCKIRAGGSNAAEKIVLIK
jgi:photosystem II stability/assembly factor-like uncharacterized protein